MWLYKGRELQDTDIPVTAEGFIYLITYTPTGQRYLGRKLLTKAHRRQKNKKIIKSRIDSGWRDYWSSSPDIQRIIEEEGGPANFIREVLLFANTRGQLNYLEEKFLYSVGSMESDDWLNSNIRAKMFKRNIKNKLDVLEVNAAIAALINK
jgi:hypothetical protein